MTPSKRLLIETQLSSHGINVKDIARSLDLSVSDAEKMVEKNFPTFLKYVPKRVKTPGERGGEQNIIIVLMNCRGIGFDTLCKYIGRENADHRLYPQGLSQRIYTADADTWVYLTEYEATKIAKFFDMNIDVLFTKTECKHDIRGSKRGRKRTSICN